MSEIVVNDVFDELNDENKQLKQLVYILIKYKSFCDLIVDKNRLDLSLDSSDYRKHQQLSDEFKHILSSQSVGKSGPHFGDNGSEGVPKHLTTETKISLKYKSNILNKIRTKTVLNQTIGSGLKPKLDVNIDGRLVCDFIGCGKKYKTRNSLRMHRRTHSAVRLLVCDHPGCEWTSQNRTSLMAHRMAHQGIKPFECHFCGKGFTTDRYRNNHIEIRHSEADEPQVCEFNQCFKVFKNARQLKNHQRFNHLKEKKFTCGYPHCPFRAISEAVIRQHALSVHSPERPFACTVVGCLKRFKAADKLKEHQLSHLPDRSYNCPFVGCDKAYKLRSTLNDHYRNTHVNEVMRCEWPGCDYTTKNKKLIAGHVLCHKSDRKFDCTWPECHKSFKRVQTLKAHMRIHTNDKRYACNWPGCQYKCTDTGNLCKHKKIHQKHSHPKPLIKC